MGNSNSYIALGSFDGIHKGHMSLVKKVVELAKKNNCNSVVYTFKNHPRDILNKNNNIKLLMDNDTKEKILIQNNVDLVYFQEFNNEFMKLSPEEFVRFIKEKFSVKGMVVGFNYRFGYKNLGDVKLLEKLSVEYDFELYIIPPFLNDDKVICSTLIRDNIRSGNVEHANELLGRPYMIKGNVIHGRQIGRSIGFPTANLDYNKKILLPKEGVYFTVVYVNNSIYKAITNIGNNPTVNGAHVTVESNIIDFSGNIYGCSINLYFINRIRDMKKFNSLEELKCQLEKDKKIAVDCVNEDFSTHLPF